MTVWRILHTASQTDSMEPAGPQLTLMRTVWYIEDKNGPFYYGSEETITFDLVAVGWDLYDPCRSQHFSMAPTSSNCLAHARPVADCLHGLSIRFGGFGFFSLRT